MIDYGRLRTDLLALALLATTVFVGLSLVSHHPADPPAHIVYPTHNPPMNLCGATGALLSHTLINAFGAGAYVVLVVLVILDVRLFARDVYKDPLTRLCGAILIMFSVCALSQWYLPVPLSGSMTGNGGYVGAWSTILLDQQFSRVGSLIMIATAIVAGVMLTGEQRLCWTILSLCALPITMWSRLAFGKGPRKSAKPAPPKVATSRPVEAAEPVSKVVATPERVTSPEPTIEPAANLSKPDEPRSDDSTAENVATDSHVVVSDGNLSPEALAAIVSMISNPANELSQESETAATDDTLAPDTEEPVSEISDEPDAAAPSDKPSLRQRFFSPWRKKETNATSEQETPAPTAEVEPLSETLDSREDESFADHSFEEDLPEGDSLIDDDAPAPKSFTLSPDRSPIRVNPPIGMNARVSESEAEAALSGPYSLPDISILDDAEAFPYDTLASKAKIAAATLEKTFQEFGLNIKVVEIDTGPVITQFELELEKGLRLSKVTSLADDLAIALRVSSVRVIAPIPGKNTVGVEVPNAVRVMVRLKELITSSAADIESKALPMFLGKDASGKPLVVDMCKMPHLLIAGRTGTGKSVCLNTLIVSMLMTRSPDQVKMLMIDPKMVELSPYSRIPHLMHPVITDMKKAEAVLGWAVDKMEERYQLLSAVGVRHIDSYNKLGREKILAKMGLEEGTPEAEMVPDFIPYIVIVADEMADMMMTSGKDVEGHIIRLAQKSRAVGIHLVLATQKPTVDVITGLIKSNLPARISFQVASRMDSRVVLDEMGADKLLGKGDMLYMAPETSSLQRAQGTYVSDEEVEKVIEFFADQEPQYDEELVKLKAAPSGKGGKGSGSSEPRERDDVYDDAVEVVIREGRGSVSLLQRALGVGYGRGARLIDWMAEDGIVGGYNGSQAREVVMTMDEWEELKESRMASGRR
ncbi:DNA translocase FtsK 4TM domain-containing protein [Schlesneria sp. DSM 10557]|uniref:DNA translocase FtsK 4TM domain-containing protein n=1 Tax=Schlesneria sp. DSM 10557 TaxID=3044399 RepID=UPI0035A00D60